MWLPISRLPDQTGTPRTLSGFLESGPVVLFFYPAAMTYGCTKESCHFRDLQAEFKAVGAQPVGISADQVEKQKRFATSTASASRCSPTPTATVANLFGVHRAACSPSLPPSGRRS